MRLTHVGSFFWFIKWLNNAVLSYGNNSPVRGNHWSKFKRRTVNAPWSENHSNNWAYLQGWIVMITAVFHLLTSSLQQYKKMDFVSIQPLNSQSQTNNRQSSAYIGVKGHKQGNRGAGKGRTLNRGGAMHRNSDSRETYNWNAILEIRTERGTTHLQLYETDKSPMFAQPQELFVCSLTPPNSVELWSS